MTEFKKILVPIDFSDYSRDALATAVDFASKFNSELVLIYVIEPIIYPVDFSMGQVNIPSIEEDLASRASEELDNLAKSAIPEGIAVKKIVKTGKPSLEIIESAKKEGSDLIIISTKGFGAVDYFLFGSTTEKVVRKAPCPVLTLR